MGSEIPIVRASTVGRIYKVVSMVHRVSMHWDTSVNKGRRCGDFWCDLCRQGFRPESRYLMRLEDPQGYPALFEGRERLRSVMVDLLEHQMAGSTCEVEIYRSSAAVNE